AARRRSIVVSSCEHFHVSQRRVSRALALPRSSLRYAPVARDEQAALARRIEELAGTHPRFGYRRIWALLVREGWSVNKKAVRRGRTGEEARAILAGGAAGRGGPPHRVRSDNGPEFAAEVVRVWLEGTGSGALYVAPASPWQNGYAESFHSKLRDEFLDREEFESEPQAQALGALWKEEYNTERPHSSLGYKTPAEFSATCVRYMPIEEDLSDRSSTESTNR